MPAAPSFVTTATSLLEFCFKAHNIGQGIALGVYQILSMVDHIVRRRLCLVGWRLPHALVKDVTVTTSWGSFHCRAGTADGWIAGPLFEPSTRKYLTQAVTSGVFVDVGSHIGRYAIEMARHLRDRGQVIALEPHPDTFRTLTRNIELNGLKNVIALNVGCWSRSGDLTLVGRDDTARIRNEPVKDQRLVPVVTLDDLLLRQLRVTEVSVLKIDVEGAEEEVLLGATALISRNPRLRIVFEALDHSALARVSALLEPSGFTIRQLSWKNFVASRARPGAGGLPSSPTT